MLRQKTDVYTKTRRALKYPLSFMIKLTDIIKVHIDTKFRKLNHSNINTDSHKGRT